MDFKQDSGSRRCGKTNRTACRKLFPFRKQPGYFRSGIRQPEYSLPALSRMDADQTFSGKQHVIAVSGIDVDSGRAGKYSGKDRGS